MDFGAALMALKAGRRVAREGWNGKGMFLFLVPGSQFQVNRAPLLGIYPEGTTITYQPHIDMKTAQDTVVPWLASQGDVLELDWEIVGGDTDALDARVDNLEEIGNQAGLFTTGSEQLSGEAAYQDQALRQWAVDRAIGHMGHGPADAVVAFAEKLVAFVQGVRTIKATD